MLNPVQIRQARSTPLPLAASRPTLVPVRRGDRFAGLSVLVMPGLQGSGPDHWQSSWERQHSGFQRVE